jgi:hypothetical protein
MFALTFLEPAGLGTADPGFAGLLSYPLNHKVIVEMIILELPDEL